MCFHSAQSKSAQELKNRFNAQFEEDYEYEYTPAQYNGFTYPKTPVIDNINAGLIKKFQWGLIPAWAKDDSIKSNTLNARIETIHEKPAFRNSVKNRCLIIADSFFEWQWLDEKGKKKQKYQISMPGNEIYCYAGLWSEWLDKSTGELIHTYTILTTDANEMMAEIHNSKKRMPVIINREAEFEWLMGSELIMDNDKLIAEAV